MENMNKGNGAKPINERLKIKKKKKDLGLQYKIY